MMFRVINNGAELIPALAQFILPRKTTYQPKYLLVLASPSGYN